MKKTTLAFATGLAALLLTASNASALNIVASGTQGGHAYDVVYDPFIDWDTAQANAVGVGGYLTTLTTAGEDSYVLGLVYAAQSNGFFGEYWAGGSRPPGGGNPAAGWTWVNGEGAFNYTNWANFEPGPGEYHLGLSLYLNTPPTWNNEGNTGLIGGYVVERYVPDGGSTLLLMGSALTGLGLLRRKFGV